MKYRSEIDGLRALAVVSVVIYHFFPNLMPSGYLGVDIFFVISGYLITNHIVNLKHKNTFETLKKFYSRRIKRLFPALFVFLLLTTFFLTFVLLNADFEKYVSSLIAVQTFWANFFFWRDGGYFGGNDQLKPLLHTWSLSVEEQFYLFYPTFILFAFWIRKKINLSLDFFIALLMFCSLSFWLYLNHIGGENPAFFLLPTRMWQFCLGGFIALLQFNKKFKIKVNNDNIVITSFLVLLASVSLDIDKQIQTLFVSFATGILIFSTLNKNNFIIYLLKSFVFNKVGKISYSVYLYHWPIAVVLVYYYIDKPPLLISIIGIFLSFLFGYLSYRFVEMPFRYKFSFYNSITLIFICIFIVFGTIKLFNNHKSEDLFESWAKTNGTNYRCPVSSYFPYGSSRACLIEKGLENKPKVVLIGNSHAQMYSPLFSKILKKTGNEGILIPLNACLPTIELNVNKQCFKFAKKNLDTILADKTIRHVFISMTWYNDIYYDISGNEKKPKALEAAVINLINIITTNGKSVSLISPIAVPNENLASELPRKRKFKQIQNNEIGDKIKVKRQKYDSQFNSLNSSFEKFLGDNYIKVFNDLCDSNFCYFAKDKIMYFSDANHLSKYSLKELTQTEKQISNILNSIM